MGIILEFVDLVVEVVDQIEVALGDLVDEVVTNMPTSCRRGTFPRRLRVERFLSGGVFEIETRTSVVAIRSTSGSRSGLRP